MSTLLGLSLALFSAVFKSTKSITTKVAATGTNEFVTSFATRIVGVMLFISLIFIFQEFYIPSSRSFWLALAANSVLLGVTTILFTRALKVSDVSIVSPIMALLPVVVALPAFFILGEVPSVLAGLGLVLISIGSYTLNLDARSNGFFEPIRRIYVDRGVQYAFLGLLTAALIPSFDKIGIQSSDPFTWVFYQHLGSSIFILLVILAIGVNVDVNQRDIGFLIIVGLASSIVWVFQSHAYELTQVAYVQAIKRVSILMSVVAGHYYFKEDNLRERFSGALIMLIGIIMIVIGAR